MPTRSETVLLEAPEVVLAIRSVVFDKLVPEDRVNLLIRDLCEAVANQLQYADEVTVLIANEIERITIVTGKPQQALVINAFSMATRLLIEVLTTHELYDGKGKLQYVFNGRRGENQLVMKLHRR